MWTECRLWPIGPMVEQTNEMTYGRMVWVGSVRRRYLCQQLCCRRSVDPDIYRQQIWLLPSLPIAALPCRCCSEPSRRQNLHGGNEHTARRRMSVLCTQYYRLWSFTSSIYLYTNILSVKLETLQNENQLSLIEQQRWLRDGIVGYCKEQFLLTIDWMRDITTSVERGIGPTYNLPCRCGVSGHMRDQGT